MEMDFGTLTKIAQLAAESAAEKAVNEVLRRLNYTTSFVSQNQAQALYGSTFTDAVKTGKIAPCKIGKGRNGKKTYSIDEIEKYITSLRTAEVHLR